MMFCEWKKRVKSIAGSWPYPMVISIQILSGKAARLISALRRLQTLRRSHRLSGQYLHRHRRSIRRLPVRFHMDLRPARTNPTYHHRQSDPHLQPRLLRHGRTDRHCAAPPPPWRTTHRLRCLRLQRRGHKTQPKEQRAEPNEQHHPVQSHGPHPRAGNLEPTRDRSGVYPARGAVVPRDPSLDQYPAREAAHKPRHPKSVPGSLCRGAAGKDHWGATEREGDRGHARHRGRRLRRAFQWQSSCKFPNSPKMKKPPFF